MSSGKANQNPFVARENNRHKQEMSPWTMLLDKMKRNNGTDEEKMQILANYFKQIKQRPAHDQLCGGLVQDGRFQQNLLVRSFEIGNDGKMSIVALANHLQETLINHCKSMGLYDDGFASTAEMTKLDLVWVFPKIHIHVDRYPSLGDVVQVSNWVYESGRTALRSDSIVSDIETGEVLVRASRLLVMINKRTRKLSKFLEEVKEKIRPHLLPICSPIVEGVKTILEEDIDMTQTIHSRIKPGWNDLDINQHVNNTKYIDWFLEFTPRAILRTHELSSITLEYRKECSQDVILESLTRQIRRLSDHHHSDKDIIEFKHSLFLEGGKPEIVRGETMWKPRRENEI